MVDILNLRSAPDGSSSPSLSPSSSPTPPDHHQSPPPPMPPSLKHSILAGLKGSGGNGRQVPGDTAEDEAWSYTKTIPTMVLYDDKGLDIYDDITQTDDYYLYGSELSILKKHGGDIARRLFASQSAPASSSSSFGNLGSRKLSTSVSSVDVDDDDDDDDVEELNSPIRGAHAEGEGTQSDENGSSEGETEESAYGSKDSGYQSLPGVLESREKWGDGRVGRNNFGVNGNLGLDDSLSNDSTGSVIELGAGSLKKTSVLLKALADTVLRDKDEHTVSKVNYYALDLEHGQLVSTLSQLEATVPDAVTTSAPHADIDSSGRAAAAENGTSKIVARGIWASYDDALPYLKQGKLDNTATVHDERKNILFLGSSIGNYSREEGADFLKKISDDAMVPGDTLLIGIDACDDGPRIERAYNDSLGVTKAFILNGVEHVNRILGDVGLSVDQFDYANRYNPGKGRHEAYLKVKDDFTVKVPSGGSGDNDNDDDKNSEVEEITFEKGELIAIERSYKYTTLEALQLFSSAGLRLVQRWTDDEKTGNYHLYLLEKPLFHFPSTMEKVVKGENPFGLPTLEDWDKLWTAWDCVTLSMIPSDLLHSKPIDLRHICLFYLGHIPGFLDIQMSRYTKLPYTEPAHFPDMFERGIDPNMEDPSKVHAHSIVPTKMEDWPSVDEIVQYRDRVRTRLQKMYKEKLLAKEDSQIDMRLVRIMQMVYEHEVMHLETLLYMCAQIPAGKLRPAPAFTTPDWKALSNEWQKQVAAENRSNGNTIVTYPATQVEIGHDDFDHLDKQTSYDPAHTFGWDNESPKRTVNVPAFKVSLLPISNGDYAEFWQAKAGNDKKDMLPGSWKINYDGSITVKVLTAPGLVPMDIARDWPLMASGQQLAAYASSVGGRLPTEPELRRYIVDNPVDHVGANIGFANWHPVPARLPAINRDGSKTGASNGGVWEWCSTEFAAYEGWRTSELYPGYSEDFFDGCHWIMLGGSFATIPRVAGRKTFTNWYQSGYPYVFAGARVAYDV